MQSYSVKLLGKREVARQTFAFSFEKPAGFTFTAGQYVAMSLPELIFPDDRRGHRSLSIASAPSDPDLVFAMRISESGFKKTVAALPLGGEVIVRDAVGSFVLPEDQAKPIVFLAGGIGITPVRSILRQAVVDGRKNPFFLFYSNRRPEDAPFIDEMLAVQGIDYKIINTLTDLGVTCEWMDERGFLCADMIRQYVVEPGKALYYIVGSPTFLEAMEKVAAELGVGPENIKKDPFTGLASVK